MTYLAVLRITHNTGKLLTRGLFRGVLFQFPNIWFKYLFDLFLFLFFGAKTRDYDF